VLLNQTGMFYSNIFLCSTTQYHDLTFQLTRFIAIVVHMHVPQQNDLRHLDAQTLTDV
jgi:hypothetical protein